MHSEFALPDGRRIIHHQGLYYKLMSIHGCFQRFLKANPNGTLAVEGQIAKPVKPDQGMYGGTLDVF